MTSLKRSAGMAGVLFGIYVVLMIAAAFLLPHEWDWRVYQWLGARVAPSFSPQVSIVDVAWDPSNIPANRLRIADFLGGLMRSSARPSAVILDVEFDPCQSTPCGAPMESARDALVTSIRAMTRSVPVFATEEPNVDRDDRPVGPLDPQDPLIYGAVTGAAHTRFVSVMNAAGLFYRICYAGVPVQDTSGQQQGMQDVWSMVARVLVPPRLFAASPACDASHVPVRMGPPLAPSSIAHFEDSRSFAGYAQLDKSYVIVGTTQYDVSPYTDRSGPEILGWALSNAMSDGALVGDATRYDVAPQNGMLLLLVPLFSALAVIAYAAAFFQLKRTPLRSVRRLLPWFASCVAAIAGIGIFLVFEAWMFLSHHIQPQVSLVAFGIVLASGLSGVRGNQVLADEASALEAAPVEKHDYDVFISYAHEDGAWVSEHVYVPFREAMLSNGRKLAVFFDTSSIRSGTAWQAKLAYAIDASRYIVPVYSEQYFSKPYCRFEIMRAHRKWVLAGGESRCVLPIMRGHPKIYGPVDDIQALSIDEHPDLVQRYISEIVQHLEDLHQRGVDT